MISLTDDRRMLKYGLLGAYSNISHFVTSRGGGYSKEAYASFNCSPYSGDQPERVARNQKLLCEALPKPPNQLIIPFQTHGTEVCVIDPGFILASAESRQTLLHGVDAVITREPGCCVCVSTADCVPILLYDKRNKAVAAVHAGWRGTVSFIVRRVLDKMKEIYGTEGDDVIACIGPSISLQSFEVGEEVYEAFCSSGFDMPRISIWKEDTQKYHLDLWEANRRQLLNFEIPEHQIEVAGICTYTHHQDFFSARRLGILSGRILSGIMLQDE